LLSSSASILIARTLFAFVANGQASVKSEGCASARASAVVSDMGISLYRVIRDAIDDLTARNRYCWFGCRDTCILPNSDRSW
jgi:predicted DCC family thiol-disulfide oxidoreductase YuxK